MYFTDWVNTVPVGAWVGWIWLDDDIAYIISGSIFPRHLNPTVARDAGCGLASGRVARWMSTAEVS